MSRTISCPRVSRTEMWEKPSRYPFSSSRHPLRDGGDAEGRRIGDAASVGKAAEKHRVKAPVREDFGIPYLVTAGNDEVVGQRLPRQRVKVLKAAGRNPQVLPAELLKPLIPAAQRRIVQGGVGIVGGGTEAGGTAEQRIVLIDKVVNDLAVPAEVLHGRSVAAACSRAP